MLHCKATFAFKICIQLYTYIHAYVYTQLHAYVYIELLIDPGVTQIVHPLAPQMRQAPKLVLNNLAKPKKKRHLVQVGKVAPWEHWLHGWSSPNPLRSQQSVAIHMAIHIHSPHVSLLKIWGARWQVPTQVFDKAARPNVLRPRFTKAMVIW